MIFIYICICNISRLTIVNIVTTEYNVEYLHIFSHILTSAYVVINS